MVGKLEFKATLVTKDICQARVQHAHQLAEVQLYLARLANDERQIVSGQAERICRPGFEAITAGNLREHDDGVTMMADARSNVVLGMLTFLSFRARMTWGTAHADLSEQQTFVEIPLRPIRRPHRDPGCRGAR